MVTIVLRDQHGAKRIWVTDETLEEAINLLIVEVRSYNRPDLILKVDEVKSN